MPLVKVYVDTAIGAGKSSKVVEFLSLLRGLICKYLNVETKSCQISVVMVQGLPDQAAVSVEICLLPKTERTRELILSVCNQIRDMLLEELQEEVAVRVVQLDPETYVVLR